MRIRKVLPLVLSAIILVSCSSKTDSGEQNSSSSASNTDSEVTVSSPASDSVVTSPLSVSGFAKGTWFFEANIPVSLEDEDGNVIVQVGGMAQSEWMTEDFVPFTAELIFVTDKENGWLVIRKDNPSALPENDAELKIPVRFAP